jgi:subtilisin family serine protease
VTTFRPRRDPWNPDTARLALRGRVVVRLRSGEAPEHVAYHRDVTLGREVPAARLDGGGADRVIRAYSPAMQVTRTFHAAKSLRFAGRGHVPGHVGWNEVEEKLGLSRTFRVNIDPDADLVSLVAALRDLDHVESASPEYLNETPFAITRDPYASLMDAHTQVGAHEALAMEPGDSALIVGVIDSGISLHHPELAGRARPGVDTVDLPQTLVSRNVRLVGDTRDRDTDATDQMGHGTACSSIIGARGIGMAPGLAGAARLLPARALAAAWVVGRAKLTAVGSIEDINAAVKLAIDLGARVLNLSFGTAESSLRPHDPVPHADVVAYALAHDCVLVAASGNSGTVDRYFPAALAGVIAVGAVDGEARPAVFTTRGDHVALSAPGVGVNAAALEGYAAVSGTSFAAPFVAGAAALLHARGARRSTPLPARVVRELLVRTARPFADRGAARGCGSGVLDVPAALRAADAWCRTADASSAPMNIPEMKSRAVAERRAQS